MQAEILAANPASKIRIFAVNDAGQEPWNLEAAGTDRVVPILQDTVAVGAWGLWSPVYRDVVILDGNNEALGVFNLSDRNLALRPEYDALLDYLRMQAGE